MLCTITIGVKTLSYCNVTLDVTDLDKAGRIVKELLDNSEHFRGWVEENKSEWSVDFELDEGGNNSSEEPTFRPDVMLDFVDEAFEELHCDY